MENPEFREPITPREALNSNLEKQQRAVLDRILLRLVRESEGEDAIPSVEPSDISRRRLQLNGGVIWGYITGERADEISKIHPSYRTVTSLELPPENYYGLKCRATWWSSVIGNIRLIKSIGIPDQNISRRSRIENLLDTFLDYTAKMTWGNGSLRNPDEIAFANSVLDTLIFYLAHFLHSPEALDIEQIRSEVNVAQAGNVEIHTVLDKA